MDVSKFLGKVIGIYTVLVSSAMLINMPQFISHVTGLINNESLMFLAGYITLILGILMIVSHNVWQWNWRVIITIFAWLIVLKGLCIIVYPQLIDKATLEFVQNIHGAYVAAIFDLFIGLLISFFGFKR